MTATTPHFHAAFPLVEAKLQQPAPRPGTIDRSRLVRLLTAEAGPPVVATIAPPGYGKTTLLAQWTAGERRPAAWLTLDELDNDPAVLLAYLAAAFDRIEPVDDSIRSALAAPRQRILATAVPRLASELHRWGRPGLLVLDDVHRLVDRTCLDALTALLDHLPLGFRVAIAGRTEPDLPLARWRAQRDLLEIGASHLALDEMETEALSAAAGRVLHRDDVRALTARTEGWAAGIYLAALAREPGEMPPGSVASISGRDHYIAAYLRSEFEHSLHAEDVTFLTRTSILETIEPPVADAVTGLADAGVRLRALARGNLLVQDVDGTGATYRYHNLLRDFLQAELEQREPGVVPELHRRAAAIYADAGNTQLAFEQAMAGGHLEVAARLVTAGALRLIYAGHGRTLDRWMQGFERRVVELHPPLAVIAAWVHLLNGRPAAAEQMADIAERASFAGESWDGAATFESSKAMLRAVMARTGPRDMLTNAEFAAGQEAPGSPWRANAFYLVGAARLALGDVDAADSAFDASAAAGPTVGSSVALAKRASIAMHRGDWSAAERFAQESRDLVARLHYGEMNASLITYAVRARVLAHLGDLGRARKELASAQLVRPLASYALPCFSVDALLELARAYLAVSDPAGAQVVVREAEQIVHRRPALGTLTNELLEIRRRLADASITLAGSSSLTAAELRLLPLLPTYLSFQEIADRLGVSRNTVKTHAMSVYGKLQASSRGEAVERAVDLGLLEPFPALGLAPRVPAD